MTKHKESDLYGKMPLVATKDFMAQFPADFTVYQVWSHFGEFLRRYYGDQYDNKIDQSIMKKLLDSYHNQGHSGYSHGVVTQCIMEFLSGNSDEEDREFIKNGR